MLLLFINGSYYRSKRDIFFLSRIGPPGLMPGVPTIGSYDSRMQHRSSRLAPAPSQA